MCDFTKNSNFNQIITKIKASAASLLINIPISSYLIVIHRWGTLVKYNISIIANSVVLGWNTGEIIFLSFKNWKN